MTDPSPTTRMSTPDPGIEPPASDAGPADAASAPPAASTPAATETGTAAPQPSAAPTPPPAASASGWTTPPPPPAGTDWRRPRVRASGRTASVIVGVILLGIGLWFFLDQTLGFELPRIRWSQLWPLFIIGLGAWIVLSAIRRSSR
jgi:hypothetical protein